MGTSERFDEYLDHLAAGLGHADRHAGLRGYCTGLMLPLARKSVEPMAASIDPLHASARHQSLHHFVAQAEWSDEEMLRRVAQWVVPRMDFSAGGWWIVDDTGFPKKGNHSVGVARQYCGMRGKQDNCQVAMSVSLACAQASLPVAWRLYLPEETWANDLLRRHKAGVPEAVGFATKPQIALQQIRTLLAEGAPRHCVLADAGYGVDGAFRQGLADLGLAYVVGVTSVVTVWPAGVEPLEPAPYSGRGRRPVRLRRAAGHEPLSVEALALALPDDAFEVVTWREGSNEPLASRFAARRVRPASGAARATPQPEQWLLVEWPDGGIEPRKYYLSSLPADTPLADLVAAAHQRWRIERDYQELKQDFGLGHYEGRGWRGFHHHATLSIAAYGFLLAERLAAASSGEVKKNFLQPGLPALPADHVPRGRPARPAARPRLDQEPAPAAEP